LIHNYFSPTFFLLFIYVLFGTKSSVLKRRHKNSFPHFWTEYFEVSKLSWLHCKRICLCQILVWFLPFPVSRLKSMWAPQIAIFTLCSFLKSIMYLCTRLCKNQTLFLHKICIRYPNVAFFVALEPPFTCQHVNMKPWPI